MSFPISTNRVNYSLNITELNKQFDVFQISTSENYIRSGAFILDAPSLGNSVYSLYFEKGKSLYVLMKHNEENRHSLLLILNSCEGSENLSIQQLNFSQLPHYISLQLLLNGMGNFESTNLKFNNLTGHLYCFHPQWLKKSKEKTNEIIWQIPCLDIRITKDFNLLFNVHTFTSIKLRNHIVFEKRKFDEYPQYVISAHYTLKRKLKDDKGGAFILRQIEGKKIEIPFLNLEDIDKFNCCKIGVLYSVLNEFNGKHAKYAQIKLEKIEEYSSLDYSHVEKRENKKRIETILTSKSINIVDKISDEYSKRFCSEIQQLLYDTYSINANLSKKINKQSLNICVIHNAEYYGGNEDAYEVYNDAVIQHITLEDFVDCAEFAIKTVVNELLIKDDIKTKHISLFEWDKLGYDENISFGVTYEDRYFFMNIHPDGTFEFRETKLDLFNLTEYSECVEIFEDAKVKSEKINGIIKNSKNEINIIKDTDWFTIPMIDSIKAELESGNTKLRGKAMREKLLSACLDIKMFEMDGKQYYFVGEIGEGMKRKINRAANIRLIEAHKNAAVMFKDLLPLMSVTFVRNGQLTVVPFPFKYLREYLKSVIEIK